MTGGEYKKLVGRYIVSAYGSRGIEVYDEVNVGTSIIGKQRRIDLFVLQPNTKHVLGVECKYQDSAGTVDEKIPYALRDLEAMRMPGCIAYAGSGFSEGVLHLLQSSELAAYCLPDSETLEPTPRKSGASIDSGTWQLDHILAITFGWWDMLLASKKPLSATAR